MERTARSPIRSLSSADLIIHPESKRIPSPRIQRVYRIEHTRTYTQSEETLSSHVERGKSYRQANRNLGDSGGTSTLMQSRSGLHPHRVQCAQTPEKSHSPTTSPSACFGKNTGMLKAKLEEIRTAQDMIAIFLVRDQATFPACVFAICQFHSDGNRR